MTLFDEQEKEEGKECRLSVIFLSLKDGKIELLFSCFHSVAVGQLLLSEQISLMKLS